MTEWRGKRAPAMPGRVTEGWLRAGFETGMLSDGPYPVKGRLGGPAWTWRSSLGAGLALATLALLSTWAIWAGR